MPASRRRKSRTSKATPKRRPLKRRRTSFASILILLLISSILAVLFLLYLRSQSDGSKETSGDAVSGAQAEPSLLAEARAAGIQINRVRTHDQRVEIESIDSLKRIERLMRKRLPTASFERKSRALHVHRGKNEKELVFSVFRTTNSGAGLVEVEEGEESDEPVAGRPHGRQIVMILDDVGFEKQPLDSALRIPATLNFAVIPGAPRSRDAAVAAAGRGHEVLCHLPMEADSTTSSPGSFAILASMNDAAIRQLTRKSFQQVPNAKGFNNHMGSLATADRRVMTAVFQGVPNGLYFVDSRTTPKSVAGDIARELDIPTASRDVFLDNDPAEASIRRQLLQLVAIAEEKGIGVGIGHMYPSTVNVLADEIPKLQKRGFRFVRASEAVN